MAELMGDTLLKNDSSESTELMPLIGVPMQNNPFDLLPNEIFEEVLRLLDKPSLRQTRAVCRKWNDFALPILLKAPGWVSLNVKDDGRIQKLQPILRLTECPEILFSNLIITNFALERAIPLLNLLHQFGSTLKSLNLLCIDLTLPIFREILENWCPNLESLCLYEITVTEDENNNIQGFEVSPTPVKTLKLRRFSYHDEILSGNPPPTAAQNFFLSILKSSPELQDLHLDTKHKFWKKIQWLPEITKNLEQVNISTLRFSKAISDASFSNKLTSLALDIYGDSFPKEQLVRLLKNVGESLEKLYLHLSVTLDWKFQPDLELPVMRKLKLLKYIFEHELMFDSIDFLKQIPNLEIFEFRNRFLWYKDDRNQPEFMDTLFSNASYLPLYPHKTLNSLNVIEPPKNPETIFAINMMFPNIRDLTLSLDCSKLPESTREGWLTSICTGFSEMENLKILYLHYHDSLRWDQKINFEACFNPLEASQSLEDLTIDRIRKYCRTENFPTDPLEQGPEELKIPGNYKIFVWPNTVNPITEKCPPGLEKVLVKIPKLKLLTLNGFYMEKAESMKLLKTLDQMGFFLKEGKALFW